MILPGTDMEGAALRIQKRKNQPQHSCFSLAGRPYQSYDLMRVCFQRSVCEHMSSGTISIVQMLHGKPEAL